MARLQHRMKGWACLGHVHNGPELPSLLVAEVARDPVQLALHHGCQEVRQAMVSQLQLRQLLTETPKGTSMPSSWSVSIHLS